MAKKPRVVRNTEVNGQKTTVAGQTSVKSSYAALLADYCKDKGINPESLCSSM